MKEDLLWNVIRAAEGRDLFALQQISIMSTNLFVHRKVTSVTISVLGEFHQSWISAERLSRELRRKIWTSPLFVVSRRKLLLMLCVRRDLNAPQHCFVSWMFVIRNVCSSRMRRISISIHQSATKTAVFGRAARKQMSDLIAWSLNARSSLRMLWYRLVFVLVAKVDYILLMKRRKWMQNITWVACFQN